MQCIGYRQLIDAVGFSLNPGHAEIYQYRHDVQA